MDPRTPVLVGACAVQQRCEDPNDGLEPVELMVRALEGAAEDAGSRALLGLADGVRVPQGFWAYSDPGRLIAERLGASGARTQLTKLGVLQTTLFGRAAADIASGRARLVVERPRAVPRSTCRRVARELHSICRSRSGWMHASDGAAQRVSVSPADPRGCPIDLRTRDERLRRIRVTVLTKTWKLCNPEGPLIGTQGQSHVFGCRVGGWGRDPRAAAYSVAAGAEGRRKAAKAEEK